MMGTLELAIVSAALVVSAGSCADGDSPQSDDVFVISVGDETHFVDALFSNSRRTPRSDRAFQTTEFDKHVSRLMEPVRRELIDPTVPRIPCPPSRSCGGMVEAEPSCCDGCVGYELNEWHEWRDENWSEEERFQFESDQQYMIVECCVPREPHPDMKGRFIQMISAWIVGVLMSAIIIIWGLESRRPTQLPHRCCVVP